MTRIILLFIDGLGWDLVHRDQLFEWLPLRKPTEPGFGYSATQKPQILRGKVPDDLGYLNLWQFIGRPAIPLKGFAWASFRLRCMSPLVDRVAHKMAERFKLSQANIPFEMRRYFEHVKDDPYFGPESVVGGSEWVSIVSEYISDPPKDTLALTALSDAIGAGKERIFCALTELDHHGHAVGQGEKYRKHAQMLDRRLAQLVQYAKDSDSDTRVVLFSDHGMVPVTGSLQLPPQLFRAKKGQLWPYFLDSTMVRAWCPDDEVAELAGRLSAVPGLSIVSETDRKRWGITNPQFGRVIALVRPGLVIAPNHFGLGTPGGMHGYHPETPANRGFVGASTALPKFKDVVPANEIRSLIGAVFSSEL